MTRPSIALSVGKYSHPPSEHVCNSLIWNKCHASSEVIEPSSRGVWQRNHGFNMFNGYLDGLFNLHNIFAQYDEDIRFNVVGIWVWDSNSSFGFDDKVKEWTNPQWGVCPYQISTDNRNVSLTSQASSSIICWAMRDINLEATLQRNGRCFQRYALRP